jgi:hypothetical protein
MSHVVASRPSLQLSGMLDEPTARYPSTLEKQLRQPVVNYLGGKQKHPLSVDQGQGKRAPTLRPFLLRGLDTLWSVEDARTGRGRR